MPIKQAAIKALKQTKKRRAINLTTLHQVKTLIKKTRKAIQASQKDQAKDLLTKSIKALDKAVQHGIMRKNTVARLKSRLTKRYNSLK